MTSPTRQLDRTLRQNKTICTEVRELTVRKRMEQNPHLSDGYFPVFFPDLTCCAVFHAEKYNSSVTTRGRNQNHISTISRRGKTARPLTSSTSSMLCALSTRVVCIALEAASGNSWHRPYSCLASSREREQTSTITINTPGTVKSYSISKLESVTHGIILSIVESSGGLLEANSPTYSSRKPNNFWKRKWEIHSSWLK